MTIKTNNQRSSERGTEAKRNWRATYRAQRFVRRFGLSAISARKNPAENRLDGLLRKLADQI